MTITPSVGRIVHYHDFDKTLAAIVTQVDEKDPTLVGLNVFSPIGHHFTDQAVPFSEEPKPGHWSWPQRS